ncbi:ribosome-inactivating family protein [Microbulbifer spongiae]|uniref:Ribosome-inactivating family protein n=1 Tax=Microbulbifer spongiae TaxID=2944933 RepID=A0ABY9E7D0_9GAMM|nr:ribosome-inactivating family protein [Microbulbifer sp. MI-G]WKD48923.1 ribosome-inactivating family protein [Microbulbifer sp. MI-G]
MNKLSKILINLTILLISSQALSDVGSFNMDLSSDTTYINSLNAIRNNDRITTPVNEVQMQGTVLRRLEAANPYTFLRIEITGLDEEQPGLEFIVDPANLYVVGFLAGGRYHRLDEDRAPATIAGYTTVQLDTGGAYGILERRAHLGNDGRRGLQFGRQNLLDDAIHLALLGDNRNVGQNTARALLRYITVIAEALRFREIQREVRPIFTAAQPTRTLNQRDILMTNNWQTIGNGVGGWAAERAAGNTDVTAVRVANGEFNLRTVRDMLALIAIIPVCRLVASVSYKSRKELSAGVPQCYRDTTTIQGFYVVDRETAALAPQTQVVDRPAPPHSNGFNDFMRSMIITDLEFGR